MSAISTHNLAAERLLLIRTLHHKHLTVKAEVRASHTQSSTPLAGTGLSRDTLQSLLLGIVSLRDSRIQLMAA